MTQALPPLPQGFTLEEPDARQPRRSRGERNNNFGNIMDGPFARSQPGWIGTDGRFARFDTPESGRGAMRNLLSGSSYRPLGQSGGVQSIINRYAPAGDGNNNPSAYANSVANEMGISPTAPLDTSDPETIERLIDAMERVETGGAVSSTGRPPALPPLPDGFELIDPDDVDPDPDAELPDSFIEVDLVGGTGGAEDETAQQMYQRMLGDGHSPERASALVARVFGEPPVIAGIDAESLDAGLHTGARHLNAFNMGIPDVLGAPVDLMAGGLNLIPGVNIQNPIGGSENLRDGMQALGFGVEKPEMAPRSDAERYTQSIARVTGQNAIPGLGLIGLGSRMAANSMTAANNALRTSTALRSGTAVTAPTGPVAAGARQLAIETGRRPGVALTTELGASVGQGTLGEYARQNYPGNPLAQVVAETVGAFGGGGISGIAAYRANPSSIPAPTQSANVPPQASPSTFGSTQPISGARAASDGLGASGLQSDGFVTPQAMTDSPDIPTLQADLPPLPPGFTLEDGPPLPRLNVERGSADDIAAFARGIRPEDVEPRPANTVESLSEAEIANPGSRQLVSPPDERMQLTTRTVAGRNRRGPLDLVGFLRTRGGIVDQGGELRASGIDNRPRDLDFARDEQFLGSLVNDSNGMTLDEAAEAAWQAGYFPNSSTRPAVNQFLDALEDTYTGNNRSFTADDLDEVGRFYDAQNDRFRIEQAAQEGSPIVEDAGRPVSLADLDANAPPANAYEDLPPRYGRVGNINLRAIDTPQDISRVLRTVQREAGGFDAARRGRVSQEETARLASEMNMTADDLLRRRPGQALNAEQALAARRIMAQSANEVATLSSRVRGGSDEQLAEFRRALVRHAAIQEQVTGATAEAGRALAQFRILADSRLAPPDLLEGVIRTGGGRDGLEAVAQRILDLQDDPGRMNRFVRNVMDPSIGDKVWSLWYNMILSGPWTHARNILGNSVNMLVNVSEHGLASAIGAGRRAVTGSNDRIVGREVSARMYGLFQGALEGFGHAGRAFRDGESSDLMSKVELNQTTAFRGNASYPLEFASRSLLAEDEFFKSMARVSEIRGMAYRVAAQEGLQGDALVRRAQELVEAPTDEMIRSAGDYARELTFQEDLGKLAEAIQRARTAQVGDAPTTRAARAAFRLTVPFVRTPINLLRNAARRTPLGLVSRRNIDDFRAGGARRDLAIARVSLGTAVTALLYNMAAEGLITGNGPSDWRARADLQATGWQRNSILAGGKYHTFGGLDPFAITAGSIANFVENMDSYSEKDWMDAATGMIFGVAENLTDQTWTSGLSNLIDAINNPEMRGNSYMVRQGSSFVVPAIVRQLNSSTIDPVRRDASGDGTLGSRFTNTLRSQIPGLSAGLPARHDVFGQRIENEGALGPDPLSPLFQRDANRNPAANAAIEEARRLGVTIGPPGRRVSMTQPDGSREQVRLNSEQYQEYQRVSGEMLLQEMQIAMNDPVWPLLSDEERIDEIAAIKREVRSAARDQLFSGAPQTSSLPASVPALPEGFVLEQ